MHRRFYLSLSLISALILLLWTLLSAYREAMPEWKKYQVRYKKLFIKSAKDETTRKKAMSLDIVIQQIYLVSLKRVDRCTNCHQGVENPLMASAEVPFKHHSGNYLKDHPVDKFGCTVCHYGQGRATNKKEAHGTGRDTNWDYPIIPLRYIQSSCAQCHDLEMLKQKGGERVVRGEGLFREKGCRGCHKLNGVGGILGKPLEGIGSQPIAYFPMKYVKGEKTIYLWLQQHFVDPRNIVPDSQMKGNVTDEEAHLLTTYILTLRAEEMPREYRRINHIPAREEDGESLYKMYCTACHASGKDSLYDEVLKRTIPAIMNPAFLKTADDKFLKKVIEQGKTGTPMTAWNVSATGISEQEIDKLVKYLTMERSGEKPEPFRFPKSKEYMSRGKELYEIRCAFCHGVSGEAGDGFLGVSLINPVVQGSNPEFLAITLRDGRAATPMVPFGRKGMGLDDQGIADIVGYVMAMQDKKAVPPISISRGDAHGMARGVDSGEKSYENRCAICHGLKGDGKGLVDVIRITEKSGRLLSIYPRDFTPGVFMFRTTPTGCLPDDNDILNIITNGIRRSFMPSYKELPLEERKAVTKHIKTFSVRWKEEETCKPIAVKRPKWVGTRGSTDKGEKIYEEMKCWECHGYEGKGDGPKADKIKDAWGKPIIPFNFTSGELKRGSLPEDVYITFTAGLDGTGMPSYEDSLNEQDRWHLVSYTLKLMGGVK